MTIFTKIIAGEIPCFKVAESEHALAFLDINPHVLGHTLVIPKKEFTSIHDIDEQSLSELSKLIKEVSDMLKSKLNCDGVNIACSNGEAAGQEIPHLHFHVLPRFKDDGKSMWSGLAKGKAIEMSLKDVHEMIAG